MKGRSLPPGRLGGKAVGKFLENVTHTPFDRIMACLAGIATGDAVGKQTETLPHEHVLQWYPEGIRGFEGTPGAIIPRYIGNSKHEWLIGETTDDTERTIAVARAIIADRTVSHASVGRQLLDCRKSVHPGVRSLWEFHQAGDPARIATRYDGCGAAIRVAPVGILYTPAAFDELLSSAREASIPTHGGSLAIAAAAATAVAVSASIEGGTPWEVFELAERAALEAESRWPGRPTPVFATAVRAIRGKLMSLGTLEPAELAMVCFPDRPLTIVPLALGLATLVGSAEDAILLAANIGGDSDSVASIAGAILGAIYPNTVNPHWCEVVEKINGHDLATIANELTRLRH